MIKHDGGILGDFRKAINTSGSSIEIKLDGGESGLMEADKKRVAIVNSGVNKTKHRHNLLQLCNKRIFESVCDCMRKPEMHLSLFTLLLTYEGIKESSSNGKRRGTTANILEPNGINSF